MSADNDNTELDNIESEEDRRSFFFQLQVETPLRRRERGRWPSILLSDPFTSNVERRNALWDVITDEATPDEMIVAIVESWLGFTNRWGEIADLIDDVRTINICFASGLPGDEMSVPRPVGNPSLAVTDSWMIARHRRNVIWLTTADRRCIIVNLHVLAVVAHAMWRTDDRAVRAARAEAGKAGAKAKPKEAPKPDASTRARRAAQKPIEVTVLTDDEWAAA